ncbi:hypothetical protein ABPG75_011349 [Micractinium tetrahymenae]
MDSSVALPASITHLELGKSYGTLLPPQVSALTGLGRLCLGHYAGDAAGLHGLYRSGGCLTRLEVDDITPSISALTGLRHLHVKADVVLVVDAVAFAADLTALQQLTTEVLALAQSLEYVSVYNYPSASAVLPEHWAAFWRWAERHPSLRELGMVFDCEDLNREHPCGSSDSIDLLDACLRLGKRRPRLSVFRAGAEGREVGRLQLF